MTYLLDVNSLIAPAVLHHEFHGRVAAWVARLSKKGIPDLAACSITELGFVRVLGRAQPYRFTVVQARQVLLLLKTSKSIRCAFIPDGNDISHLPTWAKSPKHTTNGHLVELAKANGAHLATLDGKIPRSFVIPTSR